MDRVDELRRDVFATFDKTDAKISKVHRRVFENNGEQSIVSILDDHTDAISKADIRAGDALIKANDALNYCKEDCVINDFIEMVSFVKKTWKVGAFLFVFFALLLFLYLLLQQQHKQLTKYQRQQKRMNTVM